MGQAFSYYFFTGKYHRPRTEYRVFMFPDMKSSTAHAEKLGPIRYSQMLEEYCEDISHPILEYGGASYQ
jgi:adenylate cyclase